MMIMGDICTRACAFCNVTTGMPEPLDPTEPGSVADRGGQDGPEPRGHHLGGPRRPGRWRRAGTSPPWSAPSAPPRPSTTIEILTPDFLRKDGALEIVIEAKPDVFNHNLETVPRLYLTIRPGARYFHSLRLLERVKERDPTLFTKSGVMVGLGEKREEVMQVMDDMRSADVDFITIGQYLAADPQARCRRSLRHARRVQGLSRRSPGPRAS